MQTNKFFSIGILLVFWVLIPGEAKGSDLKTLKGKWTFDSPTSAGGTVPKCRQASAKDLASIPKQASCKKEACGFADPCHVMYTCSSEEGSFWRPFFDAQKTCEVERETMEANE